MSKPAKHVLIAASLVGAFACSPASATCSTEPMLGSICIVAYNFCPHGYADAAGQLLAISTNTALFSLLGTQFGGNGQTTFALPDLRGRAPVGVGQGPGLSPIVEGQQAGQENVTLSAAQMPAHTHTAQLRGTASNGNTDSPAGAVPAKLPRYNTYSNGAADAAMGASALTIATAGGGQPVSVRDPYLGLRYCIAMQGIYPSRN
jgi:microcystin-dependent protein